MHIYFFATNPPTTRYDPQMRLRVVKSQHSSNAHREKKRKETRQKGKFHMQKRATPISDILSTAQTNYNSGARAPKRYAQRHSKRNH